MKRFDRLISDVNVQLKILEAKTHVISGSHSCQANVVRSNTSNRGKLFAPKIDEENQSSGLTFLSFFFKMKYFEKF